MTHLHSVSQPESETRQCRLSPPESEAVLRPDIRTTETTSARRKLVGLVGILVLLVFLMSTSLIIGSKITTLGEVYQSLPLAWEMLTGKHDVASALADGADASMAEIAGIIAAMRVPRTILALLVGAALGLAGAIIQALTRNPLADPGMLGVSAGAALAVVTGSYLFGVGSMLGSLWLAFLGAGLASLLVLGISSSGLGKGDTLGLVLAGAALSATLGAITSGIVYIDPQALDALRFWQAGSVTGRGFDVIGPAVPPIVIGALVALSLGPSLNLLSLGAETAQSLGANVGRTSFLGFVAITALAGAATAAAGPIGFVGLMVPHIVRVLTGPDYRWLLPYSALGGATVLLLADVIGRIVLRPGEMQAGVIVALIGAPAFIWLVRNRKLISL